MTISKLKPAFLAMIIAAGMSASLSPIAAYAYDDDVDVVCGEGENGEDDWCVYVDELKAECPLLDPDNETELCAGLNENRRTQRGIKTFEAKGKMKTVPLSKAIGFKKK